MKEITKSTLTREEKKLEKQAYIDTQRDDIRNWINNIQGSILWADFSKPDEVLDLMRDMDILKQKIFELGT